MLLVDGRWFLLGLCISIIDTAIRVIWQAVLVDRWWSCILTSLIMCFVKILTKTNLLKATQIPFAGIIFFKFLFFKIGSILKRKYLFIYFVWHRGWYFLLFWAFPIFILFDFRIFMSLLRWLWANTSLSIFLGLKSIVWT